MSVCHALGYLPRDWDARRPGWRAVAVAVAVTVTVAVAVTVTVAVAMAVAVLAAVHLERREL